MQHGLSYGRGVWVAPWMGSKGETILVALDRHDRQIGEQIKVPIGGNHLAASDQLWTLVEKHDPMPRLKAI